MVGQPVSIHATSSQEFRTAPKDSEINVPDDRSLEAGIEAPDAKRPRMVPPEMPLTQRADADIDRNIVNLAAHKHVPSLLPSKVASKHGWSKYIATLDTQEPRNSLNYVIDLDVHPKSCRPSVI